MITDLLKGPNRVLARSDLLENAEKINVNVDCKRFVRRKERSWRSLFEWLATICENA